MRNRNSRSLTWAVCAGLFALTTLGACSGSDPGAEQACGLAEKAMRQKNDPEVAAAGIGAPITWAKELAQIADEIGSDDIRLAAKSIQPGQWSGWEELSALCAE